MHHGLHHATAHKSQGGRLFDRTMVIVGTLGPLMTLPQIYKIWTTHDVGGLSGVSWIAYCVHSLFWVAYGIYHRERVVILANVLWFLVHFAVLIGIILY